jgi:hypothetical protein
MVPCAPSWSPRTAWLSQKPEGVRESSPLGAKMRFAVFHDGNKYCHNGGMAFAH